MNFDLRCSPRCILKRAYFRCPEANKDSHDGLGVCCEEVMRAVIRRSISFAWGGSVMIGGKAESFKKWGALRKSNEELKSKLPAADPDEDPKDKEKQERK